MREAIAQEEFILAEDLKVKIAELKVQSYHHKKSEMEFKHNQQKEDLDEAHRKQYKEFNDQWDKQLLETQQEDAHALGELEDKHTKELQGQREKLEQTISTIFKGSSALLNMKKQMEYNVKCKK